MSTETPEERAMRRINSSPLYIVSIDIDLDTEGAWNVSDDSWESFYRPGDDGEPFDCEDYVDEKEAEEDARARAVFFAENRCEVMLRKNGKTWAGA